MNKKSNFFINSSSGFSLAEVLVVIAIISIMAAIGIADFTSVSVGSRFGANHARLMSVINDYRYLAFVGSKPYKFILDNQGENLRVRIFEPTSSVWRNKNLMRRCDCQMGAITDASLNANCSNTFAASSSPTPLDTKTIEDFKIKKWNPDSSTEEEVAVKFCFLADGSAARDYYFKLEDKSSILYKIKKINKTGHAE